MKRRVRAIIFTGYGINSELELAECFVRAGSEVDFVHVNEAIRKPNCLAKHDILGLAGGFSYGDHLGSGRVLASKLRLGLMQPLLDFAVKQKKPIIGICNGFQVLALLGFLPFLDPKSSIAMALKTNANGRFENRWVRLLVNDKNNSLWLRGLPRTMPMPVRHGEGQCVFRTSVEAKRVLSGDLVAFRYAGNNGEPTMAYPKNPNGSVDSIAGLTNPNGNVLGLMPHPEAFFLRAQSPLPFLRGRLRSDEGLGMLLFHNAVRHASLL